MRPNDGYAHVGGAGAGRFVRKMVHNGIEYGLMQAYAEGFEVMRASEFDVDLEQVAGIWRYGSVVRSWLLDLLHSAFEQEGSGLDRIKGYVEDSGEGRWTILEAMNRGHSRCPSSRPRSTPGSRSRARRSRLRRR